MNSNIKSALLHGLKVAGHLLVAALVVGLTTLLTDPSFSQQVIAGLINFGIPAALVNVLFAMAVKFLQLKSAEINAPTDPTSPAV